MEGTYLGVEHMSVRKGGQGGTIINVSSFGGMKCNFVRVIFGGGGCANFVQNQHLVTAPPNTVNLHRDHLTSIRSVHQCQ